MIGLAPTQKTWRILVADDNQANLLLLKSLLETVGFFVLEAKNGKEAVEVFKKESPDLIWMDMRMPLVDGYKASRRIRGLPGGEAIKIVAITASAFKEQRLDILAAGCDDVVYKPFRDYEIFETMARLLDIEYLYEEKGKEMTPPAKIHLTAEMLAGLPPDLLQDLDKTILVANEEAILEVIERIEEHAHDTAVNLQALVQNFEIERIHELLRKAEDKD